MKQTELVEMMARNSALTNLFLMAEEIQPFTTNAIVNAFYRDGMSLDLTVDLLTAIVF